MTRVFALEIQHEIGQYSHPYFPPEYVREMWFIPIVFLTEYDGIRAFSCSEVQYTNTLIQIIQERLSFENLKFELKKNARESVSYHTQSGLSTTSLSVKWNIFKLNMFTFEAHHKEF